MSYQISPLDNPAYVERRVARADAAEARLDEAVGQAMRRHVAINNAVVRLRAVKCMTADRVFDRGPVCELLEEIARDLEEANRVRQTDPDEVTK